MLKLPNYDYRRIFIAGTITMVATVILWFSLWVIIASQYRSVIDGWIATGRANGYHITYDERQLFGFPRHVVFRFVNLHWTNSDNITFQTDDMDLSATPWQWRKYDAKIKNHAELIAPMEDGDGSLILGGEQGHAHVELNPDGTWALCTVELDKAKFGYSPNYLFQVDQLTASAQRPLEPPKDHKSPGLTLIGEVLNAHLPDAMVSPFGPTLAQMSAHLRVMDAVPDFRIRSSVDAWNKDSGVVEFDDMHMEWGPLLMAGKGTIGFDDDLQPEGAFSTAISGHKAVISALMDNNFIAKNKASMLDEALNVFAKPAKIDDIFGIDVPITIQLGGLFLGPVKVFSFPEIKWPTPAHP